jgi:predicted nuclease with RNAse H fold
MVDSRTVFIGIDPTAGRRPLNYAVLDGRLRIVAQGQGNLEAVVAAVSRHELAVCAVDAPQSPNGGLLAQPETRQRYGLRPDSTAWSQFKVCEYLLRQHGIGIYNTPLEASEAKSWMRLGWQLYDRLRELGYRLLSADDSDVPRAFIEVHPYASYTSLLGHFPYKKDTLEGRLQRQLLLEDCGVDVPAALEVFEEITRHRVLAGALEYRGLLSHDELDALISAYTGYLAATRPRQVTWVGDETEGQIVVPVETMKDRYKKSQGSGRFARLLGVQSGQIGG